MLFFMFAALNVGALEFSSGESCEPNGAFEFEFTFADDDE